MVKADFPSEHPTRSKRVMGLDFSKIPRDEFVLKTKRIFKVFRYLAYTLFQVFARASQNISNASRNSKQKFTECYNDNDNNYCY